MLLYEMTFLVPNYSCPQILVPSVLCPQLNLLNPLPNKIPGYAIGLCTTSAAACGLAHNVLSQRPLILMATPLRYSKPLVTELVPASVTCHTSLDPT